MASPSPKSHRPRRPASPLLAAALLALLLLAAPAAAFTASLRRRGGAMGGRPALATTRVGMSTVTAPPPPKTETDRRTSRGPGDAGKVDELTISREGPLEYLEDEMESREPDDPFHILLLSTTFDERKGKRKVSKSYVSGSISYVLDMPEEEAAELTEAAHENGMSCLGTWEREECLRLGRQLQIRDIVCRVVPFVQGGQRGWQARDASEAGAGAGAGGAETGAFD